MFICLKMSHLMKRNSQKNIQSHKTEADKSSRFDSARYLDNSTHRESFSISVNSTKWHSHLNWCSSRPYCPWEQLQLPMAKSNLQTSSSSSFKYIWRKHIPPKAQHFAWLAIHNAISTIDNHLKKSGQLNSTKCCLCKWRNWNCGSYTIKLQLLKSYMEIVQLKNGCKLDTQRQCQRSVQRLKI